jgi:hypothetical protein
MGLFAKLSNPMYIKIFKEGNSMPTIELKDIELQEKRSYLVVTSPKDHRIKRIIVGPSEMGDGTESEIDRSLVAKYKEFHSQYPYPEYGLTIGRGDLPTIQSAIAATGWGEVHIELLEILSPC